MKGLVIIDGPDCSGKSTLANELVKRHDGVHLHQTYRFKNQMFTYHTARLRKAIELSKDRLVVLDRLWMSEAIYGNVYRGGTKWPHEGRMMDRVIRKHGGLYIICSGEPSVIGARHAQMKLKRVEQFNDKMETIAELFNSMYFGHKVTPLSSTPAPCLDYTSFLRQHGGMVSRNDTLHYSIESEGQNLPMFLDVVDDTLIDLQESQYEPALDPDDHNILGHLRDAEYLIVGDEVNPKSRHLRWPFYDYGHSSLYLSEVLHEISFDETTAMWTNANNAPDHLEELTEIQGFKVVALGQEAQKRIEKLGIEVYASVPHPQWSKRFSKRGLYVHQLSEALCS